MIGRSSVEQAEPRVAGRRPAGARRRGAGAATVAPLIEHCTEILGAPLLAARLRPRPDRAAAVRGAALGPRAAGGDPRCSPARRRRRRAPTRGAGRHPRVGRGERARRRRRSTSVRRDLAGDRRRPRRLPALPRARAVLAVRPRRRDARRACRTLVLATIMISEVRDPSRQLGGAHRRRARPRCPRSIAPSSTSCSAEARAAMDLRDDNGPTTAEWPLGLLRLGAARARPAAGRARAGAARPSTRSSCTSTR